jgi:two-component system phosphate regulon sensor histidine kinase PhoR
MSRRKFIVLVALMSLSLIGIICLQAHYINNSIDTFENQFNLTIKTSLSQTIEHIERTEKRDNIIKINKLINEGGKIDTTAIINFYVKEDNKNTNKTLLYRNGILEENFKLSSALFDIGLDSISVSRVINSRETKIFDSNNASNSRSSYDLVGLINEYSTLSEREQILWESFYMDYAFRAPIYRRTSVNEIKNLLDKKFTNEDIKLDFEFAIYSNDLATKVKTDDFEIKDKKNTFSIPIFENDNDINNFRLLVNFPKRDRYMFATVFTNMLLSILFTGIIIFAFSSALLQLIRQKQISEIKSDFINNMTHEFKTPIATINLALDSIKNPKIIDDKQKVLRYLGMIKEENKRMHAQVENVLRISKLEKNELNISKERLKLNDIAQDAINHVELIVEARNGEISTNFDASKSTVLANETHFTNVIVNILENAIKYTPENKPLKINVSSHLAGRFILLDIKDQGAGMSKIVQKKVFEKFYREHTGNVHNVKGHGLGLSYVKQIVEDHEGHVTVISEKGIGSTFTIKLPLIS